MSMNRRQTFLGVVCAWPLGWRRAGPDAAGPAAGQAAAIGVHRQRIELGSSYIRTEGSGMIDENAVRTAREVDSHSTGTPT